MSLDDPELLAEFTAEAHQHLAEFESQVLAMEQSSDNVDLERVNEVFRGIHSIKGAAGFVGLTVINQLAHGLEEVLNGIRNQELAPSADVADTLLDAADALARLSDDPAASNHADVTGLLQRLSEIANPGDRRSRSVPKAPAEQPLASDNAATDANAGAHLRVPVGVLDHLMNLAGELVLVRNQLLQAVAKQDVGSHLQSISSGIDRITTELQDAITQTRMQPIRQAFGRLPRVVRTLARQLDKQCDLHIQGGEVEVDKSIVAARDHHPTHLIRHCLDPGIESPQRRVELGKPSAGRIALRAYHLADKVRIEIADDGAGINAQAIKRKALERQLITESQAADMPDNDALRLIFCPGFSTAQNVTDVSGRGVGMDVVLANVDRLGGTVNVSSELGKGTTLQITLPLTLAIIPSFIVTLGERLYALPQSCVRELLGIPHQHSDRRLARIANAEVLRLRGELLPLVRLSHILGLPETTPAGQQSTHIAVIESGHLQFGLVVERIVDSREIVVKPLGRHLRNNRVFSGATVLGDGRVALILDARGIVAQEQLQFAGAAVEDDNQHSAPTSADDHGGPVLTFTNGPAEQFAVPLDRVARIERVAAAQVETVGDRLLLQSRGTTIPLLRLDDYIRTATTHGLDSMYVVVIPTATGEKGLLAPRIGDIHSVPPAIDRENFTEPSVMGVSVIEGKPTRWLDVDQLADGCQQPKGSVLK